MTEKREPAKIAPVERRRFLSESLRGSVPMLLGWATARVREVARLVQEPTAAPRFSPPPQAPDAPPASAQDTLEKHREEFARDNPDSTEYPSA